MTLESQSRFKILVALSSFAVAQPIFDLFGKTPEFLTIRKASFTELVLFSALLVLLIPTVIWGLDKIVSRVSKRAGLFVHLAAVFLLSATFFLPAIRGLHVAEPFLLLLTATAALILVTAYLYKKQVAVLLNFLSFGGIIFPALFFFTLFRSGLFSETPLGVGVPEAGSKQTPVIMLILDEFPLYTLLNENNQINEKRFPNFAALSKEAMWLRNGSTVTSWTERAVPAILSGIRPTENRKQLPSLRDYPQNLFTLLSGTHRIYGFEQVTNLCPDTLCGTTREQRSFREKLISLTTDAGLIFLHYLLPKNLKARLPEISSQWGGFLDENSPRKPVKKSKKGLLDKGEWSDDEWLFKNFLSTIESTSTKNSEEKPPFYFLHITFPHVPYKYYPSGKTYSGPNPKKNEREYTKQWEARLPERSLRGEQRFLLQTGYVDSLLGSLVDTLKRSGIYDESLIVLTADHGSSFQPGEYSRRVSKRNYADILGIPLFVKIPGQKSGIIDDRNIETIDLTPTILDVNNISAPQPMDGGSIISSSFIERPVKLFHQLEGKKPPIGYPAKLDHRKSFIKLASNFGHEGFDERFFRAGPGASLIGGKASLYLKLFKDEIVVNIDDQQDFDSVSMEGGFVPGLVTGNIQNVSIQELLEKKLYVAIIINGIIRGVTQPFKAKDSSLYFSTVVPEDSFKEGSNVVEAKALLLP